MPLYQYQLRIRKHDNVIPPPTNTAAKKRSRTKCPDHAKKPQPSPSAKKIQTKLTGAVTKPTTRSQSEKPSTTNTTTTKPADTTDHSELQLKPPPPLSSLLHSRNKATSVGPSTNFQAARVLFPSVMRSATSTEHLKDQIIKIQQEKSLKWNFDFAQEQPMPGPYEWKRIVD